MCPPSLEKSTDALPFLPPALPGSPPHHHVAPPPGHRARSRRDDANLRPAPGALPLRHRDAVVQHFDARDSLAGDFRREFLQLGDLVLVDLLLRHRGAVQDLAAAAAGEEGEARGPRLQRWPDLGTDGGEGELRPREVTEHAQASAVDPDVGTAGPVPGGARGAAARREPPVDGLPVDRRDPDAGVAVQPHAGGRDAVGHQVHVLRRADAVGHDPERQGVHPQPDPQQLAEPFGRVRVPARTARARPPRRRGSHPASAATPCRRRRILCSRDPGRTGETAHVPRPSTGGCRKVRLDRRWSRRHSRRC